MAREMLRLTDLQAWYGESHILHGVEMSVHEGEIVTLLGRNGAGRTTTLRAIMGLVGVRAGSVLIDGRGDGGTGAASDRPDRAWAIVRRSAAFSRRCRPRRICCCRPRSCKARAMRLEEIYAIFPQLLERAASPGTRLSGGEQQMLAVARILRTGARLLLLDEISEGLAPVIVQKLGDVIRTLRAKGFTVVLVEQNFRFAAPLADRFYVMEHGRIVEQFEQGELASHMELLHEYLGV